MNNEVKGLAFVVSSLITGIALFLPAFRVDYVTSTSTETAYIKLMPSVISVFALIACAACIFFVFAGLKNYCGFAAAAVILFSAVGAYSAYNSAKNDFLASENGAAILDLFNIEAPTVNVTSAWGLYILIIFMVVTFILSIIYVISKD
ncbi:hypothetical protein SAMN02910456_00390 [Ruminococcaceae bacterium YRB3002]|nr:hypothetical protein SAMN02910456_00390 [Ruminococcaceae bacterium YRB3002]